MTTLSNREGIEAIIEFLESIQADFRSIVTNYTTTIEYYGNKSKYMKEQHSKKTFSAFSKIKSDVSKHKVPNYNEESVQYFHHDISKPFHYEEAIQIDVKKAYATVLYNKGYITEDTYEYISMLSKTERLVSVGMLASIKHVFNHKGGNIEDYKLVRSPTSCFFFMAVQEIQELMNHCRMAVGEDYIMSWVDSIYIKNDKISLKEVLRTFEYNGFGSSVHYLTDFKCTLHNDKVVISLIDNGKLKVFNIPNKSNVIANHFYNFITRKDGSKSDRISYMRKGIGNR